MAGRLQVKIPGRRSPFASNLVGVVSFTIGAKATNVITVRVQLKDQNSNNLATKGSVKAYLSSDAAGLVAATAPSGGVAAGANGLIFQPVTSVFFQLVSKADGTVDVAITEAGTPTFYLNVILPDGSITTSGPITFA